MFLIEIILFGTKDVVDGLAQIEAIYGRKGILKHNSKGMGFELIIEGLFEEKIFGVWDNLVWNWLIRLNTKAQGLLRRHNVSFVSYCEIEVACSECRHFESSGLDNQKLF